MATTIYRKPRITKYYMQWKGKWADEEYANKTVSDLGCALVTITHLALEQGKKRTPMDYLEYMRQFTVPDKGTNWQGIEKAMKYIGLKDVRYYEGDLVGGKMRPFYDEMEKGNRVGVIMFKGGKAPDGTEWAENGHFVAVCGLKKVKKQYFLYVKDSADEEHIGFFSYIKSMKGCIRSMWTGKIPKE